LRNRYLIALRVWRASCSGTDAVVTTSHFKVLVVREDGRSIRRLNLPRWGLCVATVASPLVVTVNTRLLVAYWRRRRQHAAGGRDARAPRTARAGAGAAGAPARRAARRDDDLGQPARRHLESLGPGSASAAGHRRPVAPDRGPRADRPAARVRPR